MGSRAPALGPEGTWHPVSWGRLPAAHHRWRRVHWRDERWWDGLEGDATVLPYGLGRSYGDSCTNDGGWLLATAGLDRWVAWDPATGLLRAEAGVTLAEVLAMVVPQGWFLPVTPGTKFVTLGGAVANDVHGKNHHVAGTWGCWVRAFELQRSDGSRMVCTPHDNVDWFGATIGGLGLTGLITWVEVQLRRVCNPYLHVETLRVGDLSAFFSLAKASDRDFEHTVSWVDCLASGPGLGRGLFMRGDHAPSLGEALPLAKRRRTLPFPLDAPGWLLNRWSITLFNALYWRRLRGARRADVQHYEPFFYPLDAIDDWNRMYGSRGFFQYQFVVPMPDAERVVHEVLTRIARSGEASFLAVLKCFGDVASPGWLSFPRPGVTLALDLPNRGVSTLSLMDDLDRLVGEAGGALYPAKDARMGGAMFRQSFPRWEEFASYVDPAFSSSFWRRVGGEGRKG